MRRELLDYIVCPACQQTLTCHSEETAGDDIETGNLGCSSCGKAYPIVRGVPRFVTDAQPLNGDNVKTTEAFGWQWQEFDHLHGFDTYREQFLDWIYPIQPAYFKDKVVLDAGCGMGRFSRVSASFGAKMVLAIDASPSVEAARNNTRHESHIQVIRADIHNLPLRRGAQAQVDFIYSIGVLHHLDHPQAGFNDLVRHLSQDGSIYVWVYGRENNGWIVKGVNPLRVLFTSRLPRRGLYACSWLMTACLQPFLKYIYAPANRPGAAGRLKRLLPYNDYFAWLSQYGFRHNHTVIFDHLVTPVAYYLRREEVEAWFSDANLAIVDLSWRNKNSWRGHGTFTDPNSVMDAV